VSDSLSRPDDWCDILSLHLNVKYCRASTAAEENRLDVVIGRKHHQPLADAYPLDFGYRIAARSRSYLRIALDAAKGPFATRDYRIVVEGVEVAPARTLIHLAYSHGYGLLGGIAMRVYLETAARDKIGFTVIGTGSNGLPRYVGGMRGAVERNTMRYYLAIESFFGALSTPLGNRFEKRLHDWFAAVERYPRQLHEIEESTYLDMKRNERSRQRAASPSAAHSRAFDHRLAQDVSGDGVGPLAIPRDAPRHGIDPGEAAVEDPIELRAVVPPRSFDELLE
jgi:hypothetical protein